MQPLSFLKSLPTIPKKHTSECVRRLRERVIAALLLHEEALFSYTYSTQNDRERGIRGFTDHTFEFNRPLKQERWHRNLYTHSCGRKRLVLLGEAAA